MSTERDLPRILQTWLHEDAHEDGDRVLDSVLDLIDSTPQRPVSWLARRFQIMNNNFVRYGLAAAAVVIVAVIGIQLIGGSNLGGPSISPTPQPTATPEPSPSAPAASSLPVGSSQVLFNGQWTNDQLGMVITVTIPAPGWYGETLGTQRGLLLKSNNANAPDGASLRVFARTNQLLVGLGDLYIYGDPCGWGSTLPDTPVTTVDQAIAALSAQPFRDATTPVDVTYGGYAGKYITLHVPDDVDFSNCEAGQYRTLNEGGAERSHEDPGQTDLFTVLDVNGELVIFDMAYYDGPGGTPESVLGEMAAIMESAILQYNQ
jgi:hypothetical protein